MISFPNFKNLFDTFASKFKEKKPDIDPTVEGNWSFSYGQGVAAVGYAMVILIKQLLKQFFPQTATGDFLKLWGGYDGLELLNPTSALGNIVVTGVDSTIITSGEQWQGPNGVFYENSVAATILGQTIVIDEVTQASGIATAQTTAPHGLATGMTLVISGGATPAQDPYRGSFEITVISENQFSYPIVGAPPTPATDPLQGDATFASVAVQAVSTGANTNLNSGGVLNYQGAIAGVDSTAIADFFGLQGGADEEDQEAFRSRILLSRSSQEGVFTNNQIELAAKLINGNTRVYIQNPNTDDLGDPDPILPGQVRIYILRDNDSPITPTPSILDLTKKSILEKGKLPGNQWASDVFVLAPTLLSIDFNFSQLFPNTGTMRLAIENQLNAYFTDENLFGTDIDEDILRGVINQTQDLTTGEFIQSYDFATTPPIIGGVITVANNELPVLGALVWP